MELADLNRQIIELTREFETKMVAKISVGSSLFGALAYNQNKVDEEQGKVTFKQPYV